MTPTRLSLQSAVLPLVCALPIVIRFGEAGSLGTVDLAAVFAGLAGAVAAMMALLGGAVAFGPASGDGRSSWPGGVWTAFLIFALFSGLVSGRPWASLVGEPGNLLGWTTLVALTAVVLAARDRSVSIAHALGVSAFWLVLLQSVISAAQLLGLSSVSGAGTLPNSTYLGEALVLLLPWTVVDWESGSRLERLLRVAAIATAVAVLAGTGSRVALAAAVVWVLWIIWTRAGLGKSLRWTVMIGLIVVVVAAAWLFSRTEFSGTLTLASLGERPQMVRTSVEAVKARPWTGWGPDGFIAGASAVSTVERAKDPTWLTPDTVDPHSLPLWVAVSTGLPGLLTLAALVALGITALIRARREGRDDLHAAARSSATWALGGFGLVLLTAPAALQVLPLAALNLGILMGFPRNRGEMGAAGMSRVTDKVVFSVFLVISLIVAANAASRWVTEIREAPPTQQRAESARSAARLWPYDAHLAHLASYHWGAFSLTSQAPQALEESVRQAQRAISLDRRNPSYAFECTRALLLAQASPNEIDRSYAEVFRRFPAAPLARAEYGLYLAQTGRKEEALRQVRIAELATDDDQERIAAIRVTRDLLGK